MASKPPPIPPDQRSSPGDKPHVQDGGVRTHAPTNLKEQGRHANINKNTHHQGYQQDR